MINNGGKFVSDLVLYSSMFYLSKSKGWMEFKRLWCSLCDFDTQNPKLMCHHFYYSLAQTITNNKSLHLTEQIRRAEGVRYLFTKVGIPGVQCYRQLLA